MLIGLYYDLLVIQYFRLQDLQERARILTLHLCKSLHILDQPAPTIYMGYIENDLNSERENPIVGLNRTVSIRNNKYGI
jgi:hypothetical protein